MNSKTQKIKFSIQYVARWGERLRVALHTNGKMTTYVPLIWNVGDIWKGTVELDTATDRISYTYQVVEDEKMVREESIMPREITLPKRAETTHIADSWTDEGISSVFYHTAFTKNIFLRRGGMLNPESVEEKIRLQLTALPAPKGWRWGMVGNTKHLGKWKPEKALRFQRIGLFQWTCALTEEELECGGAEYKLIVFNETSPEKVIWEEGQNRKLTIHTAFEQHSNIVLTAFKPRLNTAAWKGAGIVLPVFSLRSKGSQGIGDFGDLKKLTEWAAHVGMSAVQILPVNDTTRSGSRQDSYPYSGVSVFALHPLYLDLREWEHLPLYAKYKETFEKLNAQEQLDYEAVFKAKTAFLKELLTEEGTKLQKLSEYRDFAHRNKDWLQPYASLMKERGNLLTDKALAMNITQIKLTQFLLHRQLSETHLHAQRLGVILKGDIPIGVSRDSVPAQKDAHLFHFNGQAGAPPDDFSPTGQNWGFPTYNWEKMEKDGYQWWKNRMKHMGQYFDAYRIDHVLGFFRIWEIPTSQIYGTMGYFRPALPYSLQEIRDFGFTLPVAQFTRPHLSAHDYEADGLRDFVQKEGGYYTLKAEFSTQSRIAAKIKNKFLREKLMDVVANVLFIEDNEQKGHFHPRIAAQQTVVFRQLPSEQQTAFNRLYDHFFYFRHDAFWEKEARKKLEALLDTSEERYLPDSGRSSLLPCAEDLGMVPQCVKGLLNELQILSLEIQSMPKTYGREFAELKENPYLSVATVATHDMPPLRLWWKQNPEKARHFFHNVIKLTGEAPTEATPEICRQIVEQHLASPSMLCLIAFQDWTAMQENMAAKDVEKEQINVPADPNHYWRYRMHLTLEELSAATNFNELVRTMIERNGR